MAYLLTRQQAAEYLGVSLVTLDEARMAGQIAFIQRKPCAKVFFRAADLETFLARCTRPARPEPRIAASGTYRNRRVGRR